MRDGNLTGKLDAAGYTLGGRVMLQDAKVQLYACCSNMRVVICMLWYMDVAGCVHEMQPGSVHEMQPGTPLLLQLQAMCDVASYSV